MNSPRRPLFSQIKQKGQDLYKAASNLCNAQEKLAATRELKFNLRCKRQNVTPKYSDSVPRSTRIFSDYCTQTMSSFLHQ